MFKTTIIGFVLFSFVTSLALATEVPTVKATQIKAEIKKERQLLQKDAKESRRELKREGNMLRADVQDKKKILSAGVIALESEFREKMKAALTEAEREEIKKEFSLKKEELKNSISNARAEIKDKKELKIQDSKERIKKYLEKRLKYVIRKYEAYKKRAESVSERIDFNIKKLEKKGVDVTKVKELQVEAKATLKLADLKLIEAKKIVDEIISGDFDRTELRKKIVLLKEKLMETKKALKKYFLQVREIVKELKNSSVVNLDSQN